MIFIVKMEQLNATSTLGLILDVIRPVHCLAACSANHAVLQMVYLRLEPMVLVMVTVLRTVTLPLLTVRTLRDVDFLIIGYVYCLFVNSTNSLMSRHLQYLPWSSYI